MSIDLNPFDALLVAAAIRLAAPIALTALGELISERAGILNIGLEGMMLSGAFFSFWFAHLSGSLFIGVLAGMIAGIALAAVVAVLTIYAHADQIIVGIGVNILALGLTTVLFRAVTPGSEVAQVDPMEPVAIPVLSEIPVIGAPLFNQIALVYILYVAAPLVWYLLYRTSWGLNIRSCGENPIAAESAGVSVSRTRLISVLVAGAAAGCAGAFLSIGQLGVFVEGMSSGRGFLALAAVIFGRWVPFGVIGASFVFGVADALQLRLQGGAMPNSVWIVGASIVVALAVYFWVRRRPGGAEKRWPMHWTVTGIAACAVVLAGILVYIEPRWSLPPQLWLGAPYVLSLAALSLATSRSHMPSALGIPYVRRH